MELQQRRHRGEGSIYSKPRSPFLWIKYYKASKSIRESTRTVRLPKGRPNPATAPGRGRVQPERRPSDRTTGRLTCFAITASMDTGH